MSSRESDHPKLRTLFLYFCRLGLTKFGGPVALVSAMQKDLVDNRKWFSQDDFNEGLSLAQMMPGPLATQLAIYLGWVRARILGATLVSVGFITPPFLLVVGLAALYQKYGSLPWIQGAMYGVGAAVIAVISRGAYQLTFKTLQKDRLLWAIAIILAFFTAVLESENFWLFISAGLIYALIKTPPRISLKKRALSPFLFMLPISAMPSENILKIFTYFFKVGAMVFGSGMVIVPFLYSGVVKEFHWLNEQQFIDAVAVAMITPGPLVITVGFIGYLVAGFTGAVAATAGIFLPTYLFVIIPAPFYRSLTKNIQIRNFVNGVTAAAVGSIAGAAIILGKKSLTDWKTITIFAAALLILIKVKKIPEPIIILLAALTGFLIKI
ncbi:MAG: chromate transporter [Bacteriovoracaceae bacterium]|nr:chromate transporter [Bacteriovoracaceae bacterium]